ncbi:phosphatidylserine/phosphatidylglycerophosphate/cardiolipin synthase-like enzyme [Kitasatospora sp. MAP12-15]|uniref:phospholipase D-like domain-containing protein n=1 Tax=unclassified Kitasatospora TaxID=2633591 RepID=UPI0024730121|nr:phospholipase D-like domain-containing protein [Kitasatospora sp. MAP12-44]MDH6115123.1 phosphatidylserine/phosphatidylglycerophosphate/cardiolipin synthase-like enzyme [Kitasatospora sp. MAP12-44]
MLRHQSPRRLGRLTRSALAVTAAFVVLPATPALAAPAPAPAPAPVAAPAASTTPHLDAVEQTLRQVSPGLEGSVWQRTSGNSLDAPAGDPAGWLLQTPGCWGDATCADRVGTQKLLAKMTQNISQATRTVDISTLAPFPNGEFEDAIVAGLKASVANGNKLTVRILVGAAPLYNISAVPTRYRDELVGKLGPAASAITLNVASMTTAKTAFSWNHSKLLVVDGQSVITGGINNWKDDYIDTTHPVSDVDLALTGPAASSAGAYLDTLWGWTCQHTGVLSAAWFASTGGAACLPTLEKDANPAPAAATGDIPVIAVGGLGVGISSADPASTYQPVLPSAPDSSCGPIALHDNTNADRDYETVNPEESALRALVASATDHIEISQQDLNGTCPPLPRYDVRLYDLLAAKLAAGVKVRIVVSDPANRGAVGSGGYSQIKSLAEVSDTLRNRLAAVTGSTPDAARTTMCQNLQLASFRAAPGTAWADGHPYALHHKLVSVDGSAFFIGSKNLYPAWLQDFGYLVESPSAAAQLDANLLTPEWQYSQAAATVDYTRGTCPA